MRTLHFGKKQQDKQEPQAKGRSQGNSRGDSRRNSMGNSLELVFILDRSGSMRGLEADTIGGFNSMIERQRKEEGDVFVSTVLFDDKTEVLYDRVPLERIHPMTDRDYYVRGCTALLDAVGGAIDHIGHLHKRMGESKPDRTLFVITTDGMENASRWYTYDRIRQMVSHQQEKYHWEFLFLGANIDAVHEAGRFGIHADRAVNFENDQQGTRLNYQVLGETVAAFRACEAPCPSISSDWKEDIEKDYRKRHKA